MFQITVPVFVVETRMSPALLHCAAMNVPPPKAVPRLRELKALPFLPITDKKGTPEAEEK